MSVSCTTSATATSAVLVTTSVPTTELVQSVITADPTTSAIATSTICLGSALGVPSIGVGAATCTASTVVTEFTTIPGGTSTTQVPVTRTVQSVLTSPTTLFGTSCTTIRNPNGGNGNGNGDGSNNGNNSNQNNGSGSVVDTVVTPLPTVFTSASAITLPNGDLSTVLVTLTSTLLPSTTFVPPPPSPTLNSTSSQNSKEKVDLGPAIGGALGGFFALLLVALAIWLFIIKRRRRWNDIFDKAMNNPDDNVGNLGYHHGSGTGSHSHSHSHSAKSRGRFSLGPDLEEEPKPYQYGIVGHGGLATNHNSKEKEMGAITSRPSTAGSNYPLLGGTGTGTGHHAVPSNSSSQLNSSTHSPTTPTPAMVVTGVTPPPNVSVSSSSPLPADEIEDFFGRRAGSPVSFMETTPRKLQVINASPPSIYGGQSLHQRMMSDSSEPSSPIGTPRNLSSLNFGELGQVTGGDTMAGGKFGGPGVSTHKNGVLASGDGPPRLVLNL